MAKRMDGTETWFRVKYEVEYWIRYHKFNPNWNHLAQTTGKHEGDNPMYVYTNYTDDHENFSIYLGPFNSLKVLEREAAKFERLYTDSPETYKNLRIERKETEQAGWSDV